MKQPLQDPLVRDALADRHDLAGYVDLENPDGNIGSQNSESPPDIEISEFDSIVIYCGPFHVLFASASLTP